MANHSPFPIISVEGDARQRGCQYGSQCKKLIEEALSLYRKSFKVDSNLDWDPTLKLGRKFIPFIEEYDPMGMEEMRGIAEGSGRTLDEILLLNVRTELSLLAQAGGLEEGCTAVAATPDATASKHLLLAQNWDWKPSTQRITVILKEEQKDGPNVVQLVEAGRIGEIGFNSAGIGVLANVLTSDKWRLGVPMHIILHKILNAEGWSDAMLAVLAVKRASAGNYLIGYVGGEAVDIEAAPEDYNVIWPDGGIITHANHFAVANPNIRDLMAPTHPWSLTHEYRAAKLMAKERGNISVAVIQRILRDHLDKPYSVCRHPDTRLDESLRTQTNAAIIIDLNEKTLCIAKGPPCENEFVTLTFEDIM